ncbi:DUF3969 family protein [Providencia rettgeri]|uniref:DUF3969 family protein n=1 Tax=Providencia rettgeri TaxID=587 RepID=A0AAW6ULQ0_PRORE|nr:MULTISPECIES: DUF3969 family protein [Providencia]MDI9093423.1 DUF3969 family protein [Providencia rettgeri]MDT2037138.1 DUF3969 family protein [Providencia rettgeri]WOB88414.1 DUF3969 family protein [Providencia sp. PROV040]
MRLNYSISDKQASKFISFLTLGVLTALDKNLISIDEAEGFVFKPYLAKFLEQIDSDEKLIEIINLGCELEDVECLIPEQLQASIEELIQKTITVISQNEDFDRLIDKEINIVDD